MNIGAWVVASMGVSLTGTRILELVFAGAWKLRERRELMRVAAANLMTNPAVVAFYYLAAVWLFPGGAKNGAENICLWAVEGILELAAISVEALSYRKYSRGIRRPWLFSISANLFSYWAGAFLQKLI